MTTYNLAAAALALVLGASAASATTKDFTFYDGATPVATGSFSYATGDTGVLGYTDLTSFSLTVAGETYDLADVLSLTDYVWFAYDTGANSFDTNTNSCGYDGCGFVSIMSAINSSGTDGFFFNPPPGGYEEYLTGTPGSTTSYAITGGGVPEPAEWALMLAGFAGLGAAMRLRRGSTPAGT
jgi:hypothetical protein